MRREADTDAAAVVAAIDKFDDPSLTDSALRTLARIAIVQGEEAYARGDIVKGLEFERTAEQAIETLERRRGLR